MTMAGLISLYSGGALTTIFLLLCECLYQGWGLRIVVFYLGAGLLWPVYWLTAIADALVERNRP